MEHLHINKNLLTVPRYKGGKPIEEVQKEYGLQSIIKLASNENPLGPSPLAMQAVRDAMPDAHRYPGIYESRLSSKLAKLIDPDFDEGNVIVANGTCDLFRMLSLAFLHDGGESIICGTTFPLYGIYTQMFGGKAVIVDHKDYAYDLPAMADRITDNTRLFYVCNPNNPTGTMLTQEQTDDLMARVPDHVLVIMDEAYYDYVQADDYADSRGYVKQGRNLIIARTFSKIHGLAGLRVGYGVAKKELIDYLHHARSPFHVGSLNVIAATASLDDHEHIERSKTLNAAEKNHLYQEFDRLDLSYVPTQTNFMLLPDLKYDENALSEALLRRGVIVRPGAGFGAPGAIRVTIGTREENERLIQALEEALHELSQG
jgi:histidinol-phosphate aminotransferase